MLDLSSQLLSASRRTFLRRSGVALGSLALASLMNPRSAGAAGIVNPSHIAPRAKRIIYLYMSGGPSHLEIFDHKPKLAEMDGKPMPDSFTKGQPIAQLQGHELKCLGPQVRFRKHGKSGQEISDFLPNIGRLADDICIVRSMVTEQINHDPAHTFMNTGTAISGRPSIGSWVLYGLGSDCQNLPGFVVLTSRGGRNPQPISARQWSAGFLPAKHQGVEFYSKGDPIHYVKSPPGVTDKRQRDVVNTVVELERLRNASLANPEVESRISQYEMAFAMQSSVPELMDISNEPKHVLDLYGAKPGDGSYASNCLLARRLAERGVRFIQLYHRDWDHHDNLIKYMNECGSLCDGPTAALIQDLKQRGMLDDTLIIFGGEFGRTPMVQTKGPAPGRDHHMKAFSMMLCGGGIKGGVNYGATDDLGYNSVKDVVHVRDLHATMLHLLGIDHQKLSVKYQGLDMRLTGVEEARVVREILT